MEEQPKVAQAGSVCLNKSCSCYLKVGLGNLVRNGHSKGGHQRLKCKPCGKVFSIRKGTMFYRKRTPESVIEEVLSSVGQGSRIAPLGRTHGIQENTISSWVAEAGERSGALSEVLLAGYQPGPSETDGLWTFVHDKGEKK